MEYSAYPKPADQDLCCFQVRVCTCLAWNSKIHNDRCEAKVNMTKHNTFTEI